MIFLETTFKNMNAFIKNSKEPVEYLVLLFNIASKQPYLAVIYKKDNVSKEELKDLLLYLYGVVIYDFNKIDSFLNLNKENPDLPTYINEAITNQIKDKRLNKALNKLFQEKLFKVEPANIQQKIQSIYENEKTIKSYTKRIKQGLKKLDADFMIKGTVYSTGDIPVQEQKKNIANILKPLISKITSNSTDIFYNEKIEDTIYSFFFKTLDLAHSKYEYNYSGIIRGKFDKHILNKVEAKGIELLAIQNDNYLNLNLSVLETEIFYILNKLSDTPQVKVINGKGYTVVPTITKETKRVFNSIMNHIQYYNLYIYNHSVNNSIHKMGIDTVYRTFHNRDLRVKLKINASFDYVQDFRKLREGWEDKNSVQYSHLTKDFSSKCIRRDILEHSRAISYKIAGKLGYTYDTQTIEVYNDKYKIQYQPDIQRYANIIGTLSDLDIILSTDQENALKIELQKLEDKYKRVA